MVSTSTSATFRHGAWARTTQQILGSHPTGAVAGAGILVVGLVAAPADFGGVRTEVHPVYPVAVAMPLAGPPTTLSLASATDVGVVDRAFAGSRTPTAVAPVPLIVGSPLASTGGPNIAQDGQVARVVTGGETTERVALANATPGQKWIADQWTRIRNELYPVVAYGVLVGSVVFAFFVVLPVAAAVGTIHDAIESALGWQLPRLPWRPEAPSEAEAAPSRSVPPTAGDSVQPAAIGLATTSVQQAVDKTGDVVSVPSSARPGTTVARSLAAARDSLKEGIGAVKSVIGNGHSIARSGGVDVGSDAVLARRTPLRDAVGKAGADLKKAVKQASDHLRKTLSGSRVDGDRNVNAGQDGVQ